MDHDSDQPDTLDNPPQTRTSTIVESEDRVSGSTSESIDRGDAQLTNAEVSRVRTLLNDGSLENDTSRMKWFLLGFISALVALVVAAVVFLVVSDDDNDGDLNLEVPTIDVDG